MESRFKRHTWTGEQDLPELDAQWWGACCRLTMFDCRPTCSFAIRVGPIAACVAVDQDNDHARAPFVECLPPLASSQLWPLAAQVWTPPLLGEGRAQREAGGQHHSRDVRARRDGGGAEQRGSLCVRESCECTRRSSKCAAHAAVPEERGRPDEGGSTSGTPAGPSNGTPWRSLAGKAHVCGVCV